MISQSDWLKNHSTLDTSKYWTPYAEDLIDDDVFNETHGSGLSISDEMVMLVQIIRNQERILRRTRNIRLKLDEQ